jgi:hypothetical protein
LVSCTISTSSPSLGLSFVSSLMVFFSFSKSLSQGIELYLLRHHSPSICDSSPEFNLSPVSYLLPQFVL